jgi:hypothetical protein
MSARWSNLVLSDSTPASGLHFFRHCSPPQTARARRGCCCTSPSLSAPSPAPALRRKAQIGARLLARLDAGADQDLQGLRLFERIDRVVADPHEFEARLVHALADHVVERVLDLGAISYRTRVLRLRPVRAHFFGCCGT